MQVTQAPPPNDAPTLIKNIEWLLHHWRDHKLAIFLAILVLASGIVMSRSWFDAVPDVDGFWERESTKTSRDVGNIDDFVKWSVTRSGRTISGSLISKGNDPQGFDHQLNGTFNGRTFDIKVLRRSRSTGCEAFLIGTWEILSPMRIRQTLDVDHVLRCELPVGFHEESEWQRR